MVKAKKTGSRARIVFASKLSSSQADPKGCCNLDLDYGVIIIIMEIIFIIMGEDGDDDKDEYDDGQQGLFLKSSNPKRCCNVFYRQSRHVSV